MSLLLSCIKYSIGRNTKLKHFQRNFSNEVKAPKNFVPFLDSISLRQAEAKRSIVVQVQSPQSFQELHAYCNSMGHVENMFHYAVGVEPMNFILVEFSNESDVSKILQKSGYVKDNQIIPVHSQFLWFKASNRKLPKLKLSKKASLMVENGTQSKSPLEVKNALRECDSISSQMTTLYNLTKLNDLGTRLRFLAAQQVENSIRGMFPNARAYPFGSSVNGCGKMGCDLDLVLRLFEDTNESDARLMFHSKAQIGSDRTAAQRNMEAIGDILQLFLPGCTQVRRILQARVPIIKYFQQLTDIECDLSMSNMSGVYMSDFLYLMGNIDDRVQPLIFAVRKWASEVGLTNCSPGRWITNFSLTLLVLAFLQKPLNSAPVLPSLNKLVKLARTQDQYITEDGINCSFLRDINHLQFTKSNTDSLEGLLIQFFEFYCQFDFASKAVCLNESVAITKPEHCAMYIVNPLERGLNVSKNVGIEEMERFKIEARNAAWVLESNESKSENWGLLEIFQNKRKSINLQLSSKNRLMDVSELFEEDYKNDTVKKQIRNIKNETKSKLKEIEKIMR